MARVLVLTTSYPQSEGDPSGHFVRAEVRELEAEGHEVAVFVPRGEAFGWPGLLPRLRERPWRVASAGAELVRIRANVRRAGAFDRVVAHWLPTALLAHGVAAPLEVVVHGSDVHVLDRVPRALAARFVATCTDRTERVRVVSDALARTLLAFVRGRARDDLERKLVVAPSPVESLDARERSAALRSAYEGRKLAVAVARLVRGKRIDRVVHHVARASAPTSLVVVGDGPERGRLEALANSLGVDARFVGLVERSEAVAWIGAADVVMHASKNEGASTVLREANALAVPVVHCD